MILETTFRRKAPYHWLADSHTDWHSCIYIILAANYNQIKKWFQVLLPLPWSFNFYHSLGKFSRRQLMIFFFFFSPENRVCHDFMQIVSLGDSLHEMLNPVFWRKKIRQEAHGPRFAHLSDIATADMQMLCNIYPILSSQLMKISSFEQFLVLKTNIWA